MHHVVAHEVGIVVVGPCAGGVHEERVLVVALKHLVDGVGGTVGGNAGVAFLGVDDMLAVEDDGAGAVRRAGVGGLQLVSARLHGVVRVLGQVAGGGDGHVVPSRAVDGGVA